MTDRLLTNDALAAIAARAEALSTLNGTLSRVKQLRDPDWRLGVISGHVAYPLDDDQAEIAWRFVEHAQDDVPRLLAHIRAQDAENARLREALGAVCEACTKIATFEPGGELSFDRWDRGHRAGWRMAGKIAKQALEDTTAARALDGEEGA